MARSRARATVDRLVTVVAWIIIIYQVFCQTTQYLRYSSHSEISIVPVITRLPAVSICASFWWGKIEKYYESLTVYQASLLMPSPEQVIASCNLTLPNGTVVDCFSITKPHRYLNHKMMCTSLFEKGRTYLPDDELVYSERYKLADEENSPLLRINYTGMWNNLSV